MSHRRNTTLKVIKGAQAGGPTPPRRRLVGRTLPGPAEPIEQVLEDLDREPVEDSTEAGGPAAVGDRSAERRPAPGPTAATRRRRPSVRAVPAPAPDLDDDADPEHDPADADRAPDDDTDRAAEHDPDDAAAHAPDDAEPARRAADPARPGRTPDGPRPRRALTALLVVLLAAALAAAGVEGHRWYVHRATETAHREAVAAARQAAVDFVSVSAASVDRDLQRVTAGATGDFKDEFTRGQAQVRAAVVANKVQSQGSVLRAGLVSGDRRHAVVLVAVDATVRNVKAPDGRPSHYRIQLDLVRDRDSDEWLVSKLQFVG